MLNQKLFLLLGLLLLLLTLLYVGVFEHDEFSYHVLFPKHRASLQFYFYSPTGMSDLQLSNLSPQLQKEELAFDEFVVSTKALFGENGFPLLPILLIQSSVSFLIMGIFRRKTSTTQAFKQTMLHFVFNLPILALSSFFILNAMPNGLSIIYCILLLAINYGIFLFLSKRPKS